MIPISNEDYRKAVRLLHSFSQSKCTTLREKEERRQAVLLVRKWEKREKRNLSEDNSKDDKLY